MRFQTIIAAILLLATTGCGGGQAARQHETQLGYSSAAESRHSYTPYEFGSRRHFYSGDIHIGGDLEPRESLRHIGTANGIRYFMGSSRDGVGVDRLENYKHDLITKDDTDPYGFSGNEFVPFIIQPYLKLDVDFLAPENEGILWALFDSVAILNDALPPEFQIVLTDFDDTGIALPGEILVQLDSPAAISLECGDASVACAQNDIRPIWDYTRSSILHIPDDFDASEYTYSRSVIVHELLHALGIWGHVDSVEFPDSIMGASGGYIPNLGHIISRIDREVLQIMYMSQETDIYNDWGEWSDTSFHLMGQSEDETMSFGVVLFNGLPQPWANGALPNSHLADNKGLFGTATWDGALLGFSGPSPLLGSAQLEVQLATLANPDSEQDLRFRDITFVNRLESDSPDRWFHDRDIDYRVTITGNGFINVKDEGYEQGHVTGAFLGPEHEHMGGTVKRTDMVGAFGGTRD